MLRDSSAQLLQNDLDLLLKDMRDTLETVTREAASFVRDWSERYIEALVTSRSEITLNLGPRLDTLKQEFKDLQIGTEEAAQKAFGTDPVPANLTGLVRQLMGRTVSLVERYGFHQSYYKGASDGIARYDDKFEMPIPLQSAIRNYKAQADRVAAIKRKQRELKDRTDQEVARRLWKS